MKSWKVRIKHAGQIIVGVIKAESARDVKEVIAQRGDCKLVEILPERTPRKH